MAPTKLDVDAQCRILQLAGCFLLVLMTMTSVNFSWDILLDRPQRLVDETQVVQREPKRGASPGNRHV